MHAKLGVNSFEMPVNRLLADAESRGDLLLGETVEQEQQNLLPFRRQVEQPLLPFGVPRCGGRIRLLVFVGNDADVGHAIKQFYHYATDPNYHSRLDERVSDSSVRNECAVTTAEIPDPD